MALQDTPEVWTAMQEREGSSVISILRDHRGDGLELYKRHLLAAGRAPSTIRMYEYRLEILRRATGSLIEVTPAELEEFLAKRRNTLGAESRKGYRTTFRSYYAWAERYGFTETDPSRVLEPIRVPRVPARLAEDDSVQLGLLTAPLEEKHMILAGRMGCLRLSEIAGLHTTDRTGDVFRVLGKGEKTRLVPITDTWMQVILELEAEMGGRGYYLPGRFNGHMHISTISKKITARTGWNPHSLRHAGATSAFEATHDLPALQQLLGHASLATTERYIHTSLAPIRAVASATEFRSKVRSPHDDARIWDVVRGAA